MLVELVFCQIALVAFVAGLKACFSYNTFLLMGGYFFPQLAYSSLVDLLESGALVQFLHRWFALLVLGFALFFVHSSRKTALFKPFAKTGQWLLITLFLQTILGVTTLLLRVPLVLGVLHQLVAVLVFSLTSKVIRQLSVSAAP